MITYPLLHLGPFFFGCWNVAGHYWFKSGGASVPGRFDLPWIDGGFAPRRFKESRHRKRVLVADPSCCFMYEGSTDEERRDLSYDTEEWDQGAFLIHKIGNCTLMSWWDRCQGDRRAACNSNILAAGEHGAIAMIANLATSFPHVVENLAKHKIDLVEAKRNVKA